MATVNLVSVCLGDCSSGSMRLGRGSIAAGCLCSLATALGQSAIAGNASTVVGQGASADNASTVVGQGASAGNGSTALGKGANAGDASTSLGQRASASDYSTALGQGASACGPSSLVLQSAQGCLDDARSRIKICGDSISFRIDGVCKKMTGSEFFTALGLS